jgi:hypothetical protein
MNSNQSPSAPILKSDFLTSNLDLINPSLRQRFDALGIQINSRVLLAIQHYHPSQVTAALNHVESNFDLIRSPLAIFLFQLPKQPIEHHRSLLPVYSARDFSGFTLQHLKAMYLSHWQGAALHFGLSLS